MLTTKAPVVRTMAAAALVLLALAPAALAAKGGNGSHNGGGPSAHDPACSISPNQVALDQVWTVSAWGLPTSSTVNEIITFPDGGQLTGPIAVAPDGTYTVTGNSDMSASWGFIPPEQTGTYTYQFVNRVKWPAGTFTKLYAECSVVVS